MPIFGRIINARLVAFCWFLSLHTYIVHFVLHPRPRNWTPLALTAANTCLQVPFAPGVTVHMHELI